MEIARMNYYFTGVLIILMTLLAFCVKPANARNEYLNDGTNTCSTGSFDISVEQRDSMKMCGKVNNNPTIARNPNFALLVSKCSGIIIPENKKPEGSHWDVLKDNYKKENPDIKLMGDKFIGPKQ
jgi:hypothetical protein